MPKLPNFNNSLLECALTHRSYVNENPGVGEDNERLEFLGDAVLNFLSGEFLYKRYKDMSEGKLTRLRSLLVDEKQLAEFASRITIGEGDIMLGDAMRLGRGAILEGGRQNPSLLSSTFEAIIGAYYMASNIEKVRDFIEPLFASVVEDIVVTDSVGFEASTVDYKSLFQQIALADITRNPERKNPEYKTTRSGGSDNEPQFTAKVYVNDELWGEGIGRSKKEAEKCAAENALAKLITLS